MSKIFISTFLSFLALVLTAQKENLKTYELTYASYEIETGEGTVVDGFYPITGFWSTSEKIPFISLTERVVQNDVGFQITNYETEELVASELIYVDATNVSSSLEVTSKVVSERFIKYAVITCNALIKNLISGKIEKIVKLEGKLIQQNKPVLKPKSFASNSVLSSGSGDWYRIGVATSGLYKIDYDFLDALGIDMSNLNPNRINIYGNGQSMLSKNNSDPRVDDLQPCYTYVKGDADGKLDVQDYLVFYAKGPHRKDLNGTEWYHENNNYTDTAYYFINIGASANPFRVSAANLSSNTATHTITTFGDYYYLEEDERNLAKSGSEWYGDVYDVQLSNSYAFSVPNISLSDSVIIRANIGISSPNSSNNCRFTINSAGLSYSFKPLTGSGQSSTSPKARIAAGTLKVKPTSSNISIGLTFDKDGYPSAIGYLDYLSVNVRRNLIMEGSQMEFSDATTIGTGNVGDFVLSNAASVKKIWEITDPSHPKEVPFILGNSITFRVGLDSLRTFVAFTDNLYYTPTAFGKVENQNLHGLQSRDIILITAPDFYSAAQRLAAHHKNEGLLTHIVTQQEIFNEFSSGMRDPVAIRHFLKMFYDRANGDPNLVPKFCTILGDCSYDYRNRLNSNSDLVIAYESDESLTSSTFVTDDFYVILDDSESMSGTDLMDMAVGRIPVRTLDEANGMVDKVIKYTTYDPSVVTRADEEYIYGDWRNNVVMVSDDADNNAYFNDVENMYDILTGTHNELNIQKIHSDAYIETVTPGGERNEGAEEAIRSRVDRGALLVNYIGHGGELGWAHEEILNVATINGWGNGSHLPVFMTATCEFSRYDDHDRVSAGEYVVLNPDGGGIALFTTTRLVYTTSNRQLAEVFYDTVADKVGGIPQYIGDIYKGSKNKFAINYGSNEARKFTFLGDPAVRFAAPQYQVFADSINGIEIAAFTDTIKALSYVTVSGFVADNSGVIISGFNGFVEPSVFDKISNLQTLANSTGSSVADFQMWKNVIYRGKATVTNGRFSFSFIVPQDISYSYGPGRISFYAENGVTDANGVDESALIGGINTAAALDGVGPTINLFMNDEKFVSGGLTDESPTFIAKVFDENGINMVGNGIGHNIEIRIDDASEPILLNDYYEADVDTYKSGYVRYPLTDLEPGVHTINFKIWDVYNNSSDEQIEFTVVAQEEIAIQHLLNYPNPFTTSTEFSFEHNQVADYLDVRIQIFTVSGKLVKSIQERVITDGFKIDGIHWDGRDDYGDRIGIGTYVYKVTVMNEDGENLEKFEKLVILN